MPETPLAQEMISRADADNLPLDHPIRLAALAFEEAAMGIITEPRTHTTKQCMGSWAKARRLWAEYSGCNLI